MATCGENSKTFFESYLFSFRSSTSSNALPTSVVRLVQPVFEELVGCVLSFRGRATQGASMEVAWAALPLLPRLVLRRPMVDFTSVGHLPPDPAADYRDNRLAHWALGNLDTLLSAARAHASLTNGWARPPTSLSEGRYGPHFPFAALS
jgi:hypothetical protein